MFIIYYETIHLLVFDILHLCKQINCKLIITILGTMSNIAYSGANMKWS